MDERLRKAGEAIEAGTAHLSAAQLSRRPAGTWSAREILEHLTLIYETGSAALDRAVATGEVRSSAPTLLQTLARRLVVDLGFFPRAKAPERFTPRGSVPAERCVEEALAALRSLDAALARAEERFGANERLLRHHVFGGLTVAQWRKFHWRHTVHHLEQVRRRASS